MNSRVFGFALPAALLAFAFGAAASCSSSPPIHPLIDGGNGGQATTASSTASSSVASTTHAASSSSSTGTGGSCAGEAHCDTSAACPPLATACVVATCPSGCCGAVKAAAGTTCTDNGGKLCDGNGACVSCTAASQCPASTTTCATAACTAGACTTVNTTKGTACNDSGGKACDGAGKCTSMHCADGIQDSDETDVDCGGADCSPCLDTKACKVSGDCVDKVCSGTPPTCQAPSCTDGMQNGAETDVDCGGPTCPMCVNLQKCAKSSDCLSKNCLNNVCAAATCADHIQNGSETDIDCGGPECPPCADLKGCAADADCVDKICHGGTCQVATCQDNTQNGGESDTDCGGVTICPRCNPGKKCASGADCNGANCQEGVCQCPTGMVVAPIQGAGIYCIDATEVSYGQYQTFYDANVPTATQTPYCTWNTGWTPIGNWPQPIASASKPVTNVNWCQAQAYCTYSQRRLCGSIAGGPITPSKFADSTADQWYNACTAQGTNAYPYGNAYSPGACNGSGSVDGGSMSTQSPTVLVNCIGGGTGLLEMSGNVSEWEDGCSAASGKTDNCPVRGGSFKDGTSALRCDSGQTSPITQQRGYSADDVGFRCCL